MSTLLNQALERMKSLPLERQDDLGEIILTLVAHDESEFQLNEIQEREVRRRLSDLQPAVSAMVAQTFLQHLL